jgi:transposase
MIDNTKNEETVTISKAEYESMKQQIAWLMEQLKLSKHRQFGASSEKSEYDQGTIFNEAESSANEKAPEPDIEEVKAYRRKKSRKGTDRLPPDLPVEIVEHELPEEERLCPDCGQQMHVMGREVREELKLIPAQAVITRHVGHVYACRNCEKNAEQVPFVKAPMPAPVIKGSFASAEAIAHIATQKFAMGIPLYRQEQEWERNGVLLSRQTMSNWLIRATEDWLKPIYSRMHELLCAGKVAHADETSLQVLHEPGKSAQSKSYMWLYRTSGDAKHPIVLYDYQPSREGKHPKSFLKGFKGFLHTDGYEVYHKVLPGGIVVIGCWAHCRRRFDEALKIIPEKERIGTQSLHGKHFCDRLFSLEREYSGLPPDDNFKARYEARLKQSKPVMDDFFAWAEKASADTLPQSPLGKALKYALEQKIWLENVLLDGRLELSNNRAERSIKPFVIGRKNWMFNNTQKGANASAILYSIVETAKENGLNPYKYLIAVFKMTPNLSPNNSIDDLLPWNLPTQV